MAHTCGICGALGDFPCQNCNPTVAVSTCSICGELDVGTVHVCQKKLAVKKYSCRACGKVAEDSSELCKPAEIV
jgi:hypothetical protein